MAKRPGYPPEAEELPSPVVDNHTHLPLGGRYEAIPDGVAPLPLPEQLARARRAGVAAIIHCGCEVGDLAPSVELARSHSQVAAAIAIHPNEAVLHAGICEETPDGLQARIEEHHQLPLDEAIGRVRELAGDPVVVAIGESGLDYFRAGPAGRAVQREAFRAHIALAKELCLPLQIHDRDAHRDVLAVLEADGAPEITVFHCFSGDPELAEILNSRGWYASFAGPITFASNEELRAACSRMRPELVLSETDAPYLTPTPHRGKPNASYAMTHTVRAIARAQGRELTQMCQQLMANTRAAYPGLGRAVGWEQA